MEPIAMAGQPNGQGGPNSAPAGQGVGSPTASAPGGSPKAMRRPKAAQTFAGMQQAGMARPTPQLVQQQAQAAQAAQQTANAAAQQGAQPTQPAAAPAAQSAAQPAAPPAASAPVAMPAQTTAAPQAAAPMAQAGTGGLGSALTQQVMALLGDPTQGLNEAAQANFDRQNRTINEDFTNLRNGLNENMAARGLDASTIAATKLGELGSRQAKAQADMAAEVQGQLARDRASAMNSAISAALGLNGQNMQADQFAQRFGLDSALGFGNLNLSQQRMAQDQSNADRSFNFNAGRAAVGDQQWQQQFDTNQGNWNKQFDFTQNQANQSQNNWAKQFDYNAGQDTTRNNQWQQSFDQSNNQFNQNQNNWQKTFDQSQNQFNQNQNNWQKQFDTGNNQWQQSFNQNQQNTTTQGMLQLLAGMGFNNIDPNVMQSVLRALGVSPGAAATTPAVNTSGGNGNIAEYLPNGILTGF